MTEHLPVLFAAAALAIACGGETTGQTDESSPSDGTDTAGQGGGARVGRKRWKGGGGTNPPPMGGSGGEMTDLAAYGCPTQQLDCGVPSDLLFSVCAAFEEPRTTIISDCSCNASRPASPEDCPGGRMVCMGATHDAQEQALAERVPIQCSCLPTEAICQDGCDETFGGAFLSCESDDDAEVVLCGCSFVYL